MFSLGKDLRAFATNIVLYATYVQVLLTVTVVGVVEVNIGAAGHGDE